MTKPGCLVCGIIEGKIPSKKVYEDEQILAVLDVNGANPGHCFVFPKEHYPIIEQVPDPVLAKIFSISNKISSAVFDVLKAQGTNIFIANGVPAGQTVAHFMVNIIPRHENDGINLQWQPKQLDEEEMSTVELKLKEGAKNIGSFEAEKKEKAVRQLDAPDYISADEEDDYFTKQLRKIP